MVNVTRQIKFNRIKNDFVDFDRSSSLGTNFQLLIDRFFYIIVR